MAIQRITVKPDASGVRVVFRRGASEEWERFNPVLSDGEPAIDSTNLTLKVGDGVTPWVELPECDLPSLIRMMIDD